MTDDQMVKAAIAAGVQGALAYAADGIIAAERKRILDGLDAFCRIVSPWSDEGAYLPSEAFRHLVNGDSEGIHIVQQLHGGAL